MAQFLARRWRQQPQGLLKVDWSRPTSEKLSLAFDSANRIELVNNIAYTTVVGSKAIHSSALNGMRGAGFGATFGSATSDRITIQNVIQKDGPRTQAFWFYAISTGGGALARLFTKPTASDAAGGSEGVTLFSSTSFRVWRNSTAGTKLYERIVTVPAALNLFGCLFITHDGIDSVGGFYFNGQSVSSSSSTGIGAYAPEVNQPIYIGNRPDLSRNWDGWIGPIFQWDRVLSQAEILGITENPWQIFAPQKSLMVFLPVTFSYSRPIADVSNTGWVRVP